MFHMPTSSVMMNKMLGFCCAIAETVPSVVAANATTAANRICRDEFIFYSSQFEHSHSRNETPSMMAHILKVHQSLARPVCEHCALLASPRSATFAYGSISECVSALILARRFKTV